MASRRAHSGRIAVCGAERVREETRKTAEQRFDMEVLEGYGVTECAPVLAANQPGDIQAGTIGKMLPGIEARLEPVAGLDEGGQLWVRAAIVPDPKRGEQIILMTEQVGAKRGDLLTWAQTHGVPEISVPKKIVYVEKIPVLGTGKLDYVSITSLAKEAIAK